MWTIHGVREIDANCQDQREKQPGHLRFHRELDSRRRDYTAAVPNQPLEPAFTHLAERGLNVHAVLPTSLAADVVPGLAGLGEAWPSTVLVGSTGSAMWASIEQRGFLEREHPVDEHAAEALAGFVAAAPARARVIWPDGERQISVMGLGKLAGWNRRSPLGLGLHPDHGLWVAYRGVLLLDVELPATAVSSEHACPSCPARPCVSACPADAIGEGGIDPRRCLDERERGGACGSRCLARLACPVGSDSAYPLAQIAHHHRTSTAMLRRHTRSQP